MKRILSAETREKLRAAALRQPRANGQFVKAEATSGTVDTSLTKTAPIDDNAKTVAAASPKTTVRRSTRHSRKTLVARVSTSIERELFAVEQLLASNGGTSALDTETERRARTLASLARTLRELSQLEPAKTKPKADDDAIPRDLDELRRELARRLDGLIADAKAVHPDASGDTVDGASD